MYFEPGDNVWVCLSPLENVWKQGVEINAQQYRQNKHDITFSPPRGDDDVVGASGSLHAAEEQEELRTELIDYDQDQH